MPSLVGSGFSALLSQTRVPFLPPLLYVETTTRCNLHCFMCPREFKAYGNKDMSFQDFKVILDQFPHLNTLIPQGIGEPLLNHSIFEMVKYAVRRGSIVGFNTNATLLEGARAEDVIRSGLHLLYVSLDSTREETFSSIRGGASLERILENLSRFLKLKRETASQRPKVMLRVVTMRENLAQLPEILSLARSLSLPEVAIQDLVVADPSLKASQIDEEGFDKLLSYVQGMDSLKVKLDNFARFERGKIGCKSPWLSPNITVEGYVTPCCIISHPDTLHFGNIHERPFAEIWNNEGFRSFRADFKAGKVPEACRGCPNYSPGPASQ